MTLSEILKEQYPGAIYVEIGYLIFIWKGGAYIDIWTRDEKGVEVSDQNINIWDYNLDKPRLPFTIEDLIDAASGWIRSNA